MEGVDAVEEFEGFLVGLAAHAQKGDVAYAGLGDTGGVVVVVFLVVKGMSSSVSRSMRLRRRGRPLSFLTVKTCS